MRVFDYIVDRLKVKRVRLESLVFWGCCYLTGILCLIGYASLLFWVGSIFLL